MGVQQVTESFMANKKYFFQKLLLFMLADDIFPEPKVDDIWECKDEIRRPLQLNEDQDKKNHPS